MTKADWDAVMRTNLDSCFNMTKQVMDGMVDRGWGRVINVSSVSAIVASVNRGEYCVSKAGLSMASQLWAVRLAEFGIFQELCVLRDTAVQLGDQRLFILAILALARHLAVKARGAEFGDTVDKIAQHIG